MYKWSKKIVLALACLFLAIQLCAKYYFNLGYLPLYIKNSSYEYMYAPNQDLYRFGNHIQTNSFGMRSPELNKKDQVRILKIGDSVINGGAHIDQDNLSSSILAKTLSIELSRQIGVYNISAQSWGPDNAFAYIKQHGNFNADIFVLVFSSHDLHDNMHFKDVVGNHAAWPNQQPLCAFTDAWSRYAWPKVQSLFGAKNEEYDYLYDFDDSKINQGWHHFFEYCSKKSIPLLVYLHAEKVEVRAKQYNKYGQQLCKMLDSAQIKYIKGINHITSEDAYRDNIHLNANGHAKLAKTLDPIVKEMIKELVPR